MCLGQKYLLLKVKTERFEYFQVPFFFGKDVKDLMWTYIVPRSVLHFELLLFSTLSLARLIRYEQFRGGGRGGESFEGRSI